MPVSSFDVPPDTSISPRHTEAIHRFQTNGDEQSLRLLLDDYRPLTSKLAARACREAGLHDSDALQDACQGAELGLIQAIRQFDHCRGTTLGAYAQWLVLDGARNAVHSISRSNLQGLPREAFLDEEMSKAGEALARLAMERSVAEEVQLLDGIGSDAVQSYLESLPAQQRRVIHLKYWQHLSQAEIARELGNTRAAVNKLHAKALEHGRNNPELALLFSGLTSA